MLPEGIAPEEVTATEDRQLAAIVTGVAQARATVAAAQAAETTMLAAAQLIVEQRIARALSGSSAIAEMPLRSFAAELGAMLRVGDRSMQTQMAHAADIALRFPTTLTALLGGAISRRHLEYIVEAGTHITDDVARGAYEASILEYAATTTAARTKPVAKLRAEKYEPRTVSERHEAAAAERGVWVRELPDGLAQLVAVLPAVLAHGVMGRLGQMAVAVKDARPEDSVDDRKIDALRADILSDLLLSGTPTAHESGPTGLGAIRAHVQVTVPIEALESDSVETAPAMLHGFGPIDTPTARTLAGAAPGWDRVTHTPHGHVLTVDRYRPSEAQRRLLGARDQHCRFPGCRQPLTRCDIDHTIDAQHGGPTTTQNLAHLCRRHHTLKHASPWTVHQDPDGTLHWTSPTGRHHPDTPTSTVIFTTEDSPPF